jgi:hypothetical protein
VPRAPCARPVAWRLASALPAPAFVLAFWAANLAPFAHLRPHLDGLALIAATVFTAQLAVRAGRRTTTALTRRLAAIRAFALAARPTRVQVVLDWSDRRD